MPDEGSRRTYTGEKIDVSYDRALCWHAAECIRGLPEVFHPENRPWITPDAADPDLVAEVVRRCPSGALRYERHGVPEA